MLLEYPVKVQRPASHLSMRTAR